MGKLAPIIVNFGEITGKNVEDAKKIAIKVRGGKFAQLPGLILWR
jgi:hypothetical protein